MYFRKNNPYKCIRLCILTLASFALSNNALGQKISFMYDESGNRIKRERVQVFAIDAEDEEVQKFLTSESIDEIISITTDQNKELIYIDIKDEKFNGSSQIELYKVNGYKVFGAESPVSLYNLDLTRFENGIYILVVTYQGRVSVSKIILSR